MSSQATPLKLSTESLSKILKFGQNSGTVTKTLASSSSSATKSLASSSSVVFRMPNYEEIVLRPMPISKTMELDTIYIIETL